MQVKLIECSSLKPLMLACGKPYGTEPTPELVKRVWDSGHRSIARHSIAAFDIKGVSVSLLTHISRHPLLNLTVESSRFSDMSDKESVIPPFLQTKDIEKYETDYNVIMSIVKEWKNKKGYDDYQQRHLSKLFLPKNSTLDLIVSGNFQAIYEFLQLRNCVKRVEWEILELADRMSCIMREQIPEIFCDIGCKGDETGLCPEHKSCGKYITIKEFICKGEYGW